MKIEIQKDGVRQSIGEQYLNQFLEKGWTPVSDTGPKKISKNVIKASADVVEPLPKIEEVQSNPPIIDKGE